MEDVTSPVINITPEDFIQVSTGESLPAQTTVSGGFVVFACTAEAILMILICGTNGIVLSAFVRTPALRTITNYYIVQMAVADISVGLWMPLHIVMFIYPHILDNISLCTFRYASLLLSLGGSIFSLLALTYDRLTAIVYPLHYHGNLTLRSYILSAIFVWTCPIAMSVLTMCWHNQWSELPFKDCDLIFILKVEYIRYLLLPEFVVITTVMVGMYVVILRVARRQALSQPPQLSSASSSSTPQPHHHHHQEMKMVKTGLIVFCSFYCCWLPLILLILYQVSWTPVMWGSTLTTLRSAAVFPAVFNSAINPLVYALRLPLYKMHFHRLLGCRRNQVHVH